MRIRSKDQVVVISGSHKGKRGKVLTAFPKTGKVIVEGVAVVTKHQKARGQGQPGGIIHKESAIDVSNVMLICQKCGAPTRVGKVPAMVEKSDGTQVKKMVRACKKCKAQID
jgi:large subunit ribosomal protein L24